MARNWKQMSTHIPALLKVIPLISGDVCEIGSGFNSTPLLHWITLGRKLVTYENDPDYLNFAKKFQTKSHRVRTLDQIEFDRHWSVVFIDHDNKRVSRGEVALKFKHAQIIILHDSENERNYGYDKIWPHFKYRYDFKEYVPWTSVVSNTIDVCKLLS